MSLVDDIRSIQRAVGAEPDGVFGPATAAAVRKHLAGVDLLDPVTVGETPTLLDERTMKNIATLDPKLQDRMIAFGLKANATAATFGCQYVMTDGNRSLAEQEEIYAQGRTKPGKIVSNARPGYSWHNLKAAGDFAVFQGKAYLDQTNPALAAKVHAACAIQAAGCGLKAGAYWKKADLPHYQAAELPDSPTAAHRAKFKAEGSVL